MQCGRFGSDPPYVAVLTKCSVTVLVVAVLVAKRFVAVLGVAVLECGRFDQDPLRWLCRNSSCPGAPCHHPNIFMIVYTKSVLPFKKQLIAQVFFRIRHGGHGTNSKIRNSNYWFTSRCSLQITWPCSPDCFPACTAVCSLRPTILFVHYSDVIMSAVVPQITSLTIVYSTVYSGADQRKHQSSASLAFCREFTGYRWIPNTKGR